MRTPWRLVTGHLRTHWLRSGLTMLAMSLALFLFCFVVSVVTSLEQAITSAAANRLIVQSAVSLFVNLPLDYQAKIEGVPGVADVSKMQWFGGYHKDEGNFFAQFAVDHDQFFDMYARDMTIAEGPGQTTGPAARQAALTAFSADRRACIIGPGLVHDFGWKVGDTVPITARIFTKDDGSAWDFLVVGIYEPTKSNVDDRTLWFRYDYLRETLIAEGRARELGTGVYVVNVAPDSNPAQVNEQIDALFSHGPQRTKTTTEAAFQTFFVGMLGNVPAFMGSIGGAIVFAVLFSVVNTMLMAGRQRRNEQGILKALGFPARTIAHLLIAEALFLSFLGGATGVVVAKVLEDPLRDLMGGNLPNYHVALSTIGLGLLVSLVVGIVAGLGPAMSAMRLAPSEALGSEG